MAIRICQPAVLDPEDKPDVPSDPAALVTRALAFWGDPPISATTRTGLERYAAGALGAAHAAWEREQYPVLVLNALRMLIAVCPDELTS
jgi:hypothetical protein